MEMKSKERMEAALAFQPVDRTPVYPLDFSTWVINEENMNYDQVLALDDAGASLLVKYSYDLKSDGISTGSGAWQAWATAFGSIAKTSDTSISVKNTITEVDELPDLTYDQLRETFLKNRVVQAMIKQIQCVKNAVGDDKMLITDLSGPITAANGLIGADNLMCLIAEQDEDLDQLLDFSSRCVAVLADLYHEAGTDLMVIAEPVSSGDMISLNMYKEVALPAFKSFLEKVHTSFPFSVHICGNAGDRCEYVRDLSAKGFSVDYMVDMEDVLKKADHKICIFGNLAPSDQLLLGTPESVYAESTRLLELAHANGGGLVLGTGCDLPAGSPIENIHAMVKAAEDFAAAHK